MSSEKADSASSLTTMRNAFGELRESEGELESFLNGMFDQLESMMVEVFARHKYLEASIQRQNQQEASAQERDGAFRECLEGMRSLEANTADTHNQIARVLSEITETHQQFLREHVELRETQEELRRIGAECHAMREAAERDRGELHQLQDCVQEQLQRLTAVASEWATQHAPADNNGQFAEALEAARRQEAAWRQDRAELESKLEAERQRNAQQNDSLAEQRRLAAAQQGELAGELKRMRSLLELLSNHMSQPVGANAATGQAAAAVSEEDSLTSMLAQFQILQRDLSQRKADRQKPVTKS
jgi:hypothetical protein